MTPSYVLHLDGDAARSDSQVKRADGGGEAEGERTTSLLGSNILPRGAEERPSVHRARLAAAGDEESSESNVTRANLRSL
eukprot:CAMPEP_0204040988 /NCGR_PEP_ID=MMETSP0360-20130528/92865_1 /ASSEMBLY_ACC=CAM_ASM_000342 /TAXON_ID=268821 /ORGANISM="Scrippsiella Hangoei, Strain SHTV-5" /LENGTH=79 /DNA_ID=CAMNT_0050987077 /DNA_START=99 /DNA_END=338 /DNA_ORIENTATION=-